MYVIADAIAYTMFALRGIYMNINFEEEIKKNNRKKIVKECLIWLIEIIVVILAAFLIVNVCFRRTSTIGSAMEPTLYNGEEVILNTKAYLIFSPGREDVIAFYDKEDVDSDGEEPLLTFRRVIGLPGEKVQIAEGKIWIDGKELTEKYTYLPIAATGIAEQEITLEEDEYFVLCDSRGDTNDSRNAAFGNIKRSQIVGKVSFKYKPFSRVTGPDSKAYETEKPKEK